jgi:sarcosine oxidase gamma subunit
MTAHHLPLSVRVEHLPEGSTFEFVLFAAAGQGDWVALPGEVEAKPDGSLARLCFAPRRWLVPGAEPGMLARMAAASEAGAGTCIEVSGKWVPMLLSGADARLALSSSIDVAAVLARSVEGYRLWVAASYADCFVAAIRRLAGG